MYQDLRSKLEMYKKNQAQKPDKPGVKRFDINPGMQGVACENEYGKYFIIEKRYPLEHMRGGFSLGALLEIDLQSLVYVFGDMDSRLSVKDLIFLDTETTGLSGGVGTVAFLIGTGYFEDGCFVMRQYFMRDYDEEPAMLRDLNELLEKFRGLITFNGKAFDWNLINTRFTFNRIRNSLKTPIHMDLLFPSRKIWKLKLESCRLTNLEEKILGEYRVEDIPGAQIPSIYFRYLEDRNTEEIEKVIKHNELDILSMVSLIAKIHGMLKSPLSETDGDKELLSIGAILENKAEFDIMIDCYRNCVKSGSSFVKEAASRRLANIYRKNKDFDNAVKQWEQMLADKNTFSIYPLIELAKYYEHKQKDFIKAMEMVEKAVQLVSKTGLNNRMHFTEIKKRYDRLKRKAGKNNA